MKISPIKIINLWNETEKYPLGKSIFACCKCNSFSIEEDAYNSLSTLFKNYEEKFQGYLNYYFASRGAGKPKYNFAFIDLTCSKCGEQHKAFFYVKFKETYFPKDVREFFLADMDRQNLPDNIDGVYSRAVCQVFMRKLFIRWYILKKLTYVAVPFIGNAFQKPEQRIELLNEFLTNVHPYKTLLITRTDTLNQIKKDIDADLGTGAYDMLNEQNSLHPVIKYAFPKTNFHAKFYCGIDKDGVEVLVGSHNLHGGEYMENLMFKNYNLTKFIDRYLFQLNVVPTIPDHTEIEVLIFDRDKKLHIDTFKTNASDIVNKHL